MCLNLLGMEFMKKSLAVLTLFIVSSSLIFAESIIKMEVNGKAYVIKKGSEIWDDSGVSCDPKDGQKSEKVWIYSKLYQQNPEERTEGEFVVGIELYLPKPAGTYKMENKLFKADRYRLPQINLNLGKVAFGEQSKTTSGNYYIAKPENQGDLVVEYSLEGKKIVGTFSAKLHKYGVATKMYTAPPIIQRDAYVITNGSFVIDVK